MFTIPQRIGKVRILCPELFADFCGYTPIMDDREMMAYLFDSSTKNNPQGLWSNLYYKWKIQKVNAGKQYIDPFHRQDCLHIDKQIRSYRIKFNKLKN